MKKICIFAHFNKNNNLEDYVIDYLNTLRNLVDEIIFVSTTDIKTDKMNILDSLVNKIIIKENRGYDFGSWREGLLFIKNNYKKLPTEIILCNDSCYISREKLIKAIKYMRGNKKLDFWGITKNYSFAIHIQSYFVALNSRPLNDDKFWDLVYSWKHQNRKIDYILKYEIGLTQFLLKRNYKIDSYIKLTFLTILLIKFIYKLSYLKKQIVNAIKYQINNKFQKGEDFKKSLEGKEQLESNLYIKKFHKVNRFFSAKFFIKTVLQTNITHLNSREQIFLNIPILKVSKTPEILKEEGIKKLNILCKKNGFNYDHIIEHQKFIN